MNWHQRQVIASRRQNDHQPVLMKRWVANCVVRIYV